MENGHRQCRYKGEQYGLCQDPCLAGSHYCFWHDPEIDKSSIKVRPLLEARARNGIPMEGFLLKQADLENLNLVNHHGSPFKLVGADLCRANLHRAHLYQVDLSGSNLLKADLSQANLNYAHLSGCNLLGSNMKGARVEQVDWGKKLYQEEKATEAERFGRKAEAAQWYAESEEVARTIRKSCEGQGLFNVAGRFFYREQVFRRHRFPRWSWARLVSKFVDLISGYGEKPGRVVQFSVALIACCSFCYFAFGIVDGDRLVRYASDRTLGANFLNWLDTLYFSVVTFTTLGYGDLTPVGFSRAFAAFEAFIGSFTLALFVVVFVKKMTR